MTATKCTYRCKYYDFKLGYGSPICKQQKMYCADAVYVCTVPPKKCIDCLHCKTDRYSTGNLQYAYCDRRKDHEHKEVEHYKNKNACNKFVDMG